jgi:hypothetical protein
MQLEPAACTQVNCMAGLGVDQGKHLVTDTRLLRLHLHLHLLLLLLCAASRKAWSLCQLLLLLLRRRGALCDCAAALHQVRLIHLAVHLQLQGTCTTTAGPTHMTTLQKNCAASQRKEALKQEAERHWKNTDWHHVVSAAENVAIAAEMHKPFPAATSTPARPALCHSTSQCSKQ